MTRTMPTVLNIRSVGWSMPNRFRLPRQRWLQAVQVSHYSRFEILRIERLLSVAMDVSVGFGAASLYVKRNMILLALSLV
jgi:hypothetical protein